MPKPTADDLKQYAEASAEALVRELRGIAGDLAPDYAAKARDIADVARRLAVDYATGSISQTQFEGGVDALKLTARSVAASGMLDIYGQRKRLADFGIGVLVKALVAIATGAPLL